MRGNIICLDQCAWIALANIFNRKHPFNNNLSPDPEHEKLLSHVIELYDRKQTFFPITLERQFETLKPKDPVLRIKLAQFMVNLSRCITMGPCDDRLIKREIYNHLIDLHNLPHKKYAFPSTIMGVGLLGMLDAHIESSSGDTGEVKKISDYLCSPDCMVKVLSDSFDDPIHLRDSIIESSKIDLTESGKRYLENIRNDLARNNKNGVSWQDYQNARDRDFFIDKIVPISSKVFTELGIEGGVPPKNGKMCTSWDDLYINIPSVYVINKLLDERDRRQSGIDDPNDFIDVPFLSYTIPYGSVVVTDQKWADIARYLKMDIKFQTKIISVSEFIHADVSSITDI